MAPRPFTTHRTVRAGCLGCGAAWTGGNAQGVAAKHYDQTGHTTWVEVQMTIRYGGGDAKPAAKAARKAPSAAALAGFVGLGPKTTR